VAGAVTRFEFLEILVRCAKARYLTHGLADSYAEAVSLLLENYVIKNYKEEEWDLFRRTQLFTQSCSDLFAVNMEGIT